MAYGRLDVFWPEGRFETYLLEQPTVSIGRSSGNTLELDTTTISRYHISITHADDGVYLTDLDSANGTFVDGARLRGNAPQLLYGGEEITIGVLRLIYHDEDETPTRPISLPQDTTQRIELADSIYHIQLEGPDQPVAPGAHISANLWITNTSEVTEHYRVGVMGLPPTWVRVDRHEVAVEPGDNAEVVINFKPTRRSDSAPGDYPLQITVRPNSDPSRQLKAEAQLRVLPFGGFGMALEQRDIERGGRFLLHLHNQGSSPLTLRLMGRDYGHRLRYTFPNPQVTLAPGQRLRAEGQVRASRRRVFGDPRRYPFDVIARSCDSAAYLVPVRGYLLDQPPLPFWSTYVFGGLGLALLALLFFALLVILQPAPPEIDRFEISEGIVLQGTPIGLEWAVSNAESLVVAVNGLPLEPTLDPAADSLLLDTSTLSGDVTISLAAVRGDDQAAASHTVRVEIPLRVRSFTAEPPSLRRYVAESLTLRWEVARAVNVRIAGLDGFTTDPLSDVYGAQGELTVGGIATGPLALMLSAEDETGTPIQQQLVIDTVAPTCTALADPATLYAGPAPAFQVISSVPAGVALVVDARDTTSAWLRFLLEGDAQGWGQQTDFVCAGFSPAALRIAVDVPVLAPTELPPPTIPPSPSLTLPLVPTLAPTRTPPPTATPTPTLTPTTTTAVTAAPPIAARDVPATPTPLPAP
ncbi:MAG: FHA domain-containing protein [Chloroflexi bacterium]|nr:FHA domain-containing protein [Chloroflexota bacterium]